jgi:hypothetical protein
MTRLPASIYLTHEGERLPAVVFDRQPALRQASSPPLMPFATLSSCGVFTEIDYLEIKDATL